MENYKEKRSSPRFKTELEVKLPEGSLAKSFDLGEGGLSLHAQEIISSPKVLLSIKFPGREPAFKANAQLVWQRNTDSGDSVYGVKFAKLNDSQKRVLRKKLVQNQVEKLVENLKDEETKNYISQFFLKDILDYINEITALTLKQPENENDKLNLEKEIEHLNNKILLKGYCLELLLSDKKVVKKVKESFRDLVGSWVYKSAIVKRAFDKPEGYPEDFRMMDLIYQNKPVSKNIGFCFDNIFLKSPYAVAIRNRKSYLSKKIIEFINYSQPGPLNVLSLCSGTGYEVAEALPLLSSEKKVNFTFIETDSKALDFSRNLLAYPDKSNFTFNFNKENVYRVLSEDENLVGRYGRQDFIYALGIVDYLSARAAKRIIKILYRMLKEGGQLLLTHRNRDKTFPPIPPDWLCDWKVISRNKKEMESLFYEAGISKFSLKTESDNFGYIYYFMLSKTDAHG